MNATQKQTRTVRYPTKRSVNLAKREPHTKSAVTLAAGIALIAVLCACVAKFGVMDQLARQNAAEAACAQVHTQYVQMQSELADYDEVLEQYRTYSRAWMKKEDSGAAITVDRQEVLDLLQTQLMPYGQINTVTISDDVVIASMSGMNLGQISVMFERLQQQPIVASASLTIASTEKNTQSAELDFSITIILQAAAEEADA